MSIRHHTGAPRTTRSICTNPPRDKRRRPAALTAAVDRPRRLLAATRPSKQTARRPNPLNPGCRRRMPPDARQRPCHRTRPCGWRTRRSTTTHARSDCHHTRRIVRAFTVDVRARFVGGLLVDRIHQRHDTIAIYASSHHHLLGCFDALSQPHDLETVMRPHSQHLARADRSRMPPQGFAVHAVCRSPRRSVSRVQTPAGCAADWAR